MPALSVQEPGRARRRAGLAWLGVIALTAIWFLLPVGRPLTHPDEGRYSEIPRELLASGDWVTPRLNGVPYLEKPPLQYWATAIVYGALGEGEWTARLWTTLTGYLDVLLVFLLGRRLWNTRAGVMAAAILGSSVLHVAMGQIVTLDMAFTFLMTGMLCAFCMTQLQRGSRSGGKWMLASWTLLGLATLTKGVVAVLIAASALSIYTLWQRDWAIWRALRPVAGPLLFGVVTAPWFVLAARADPDFLQFFFIHEHLQRYLSDVHDRYEPSWFYLVILALGVLPWLPQMSGVLFNGWRASAPAGQFDARRLLWVWSVFILVFFSLSHSKLAPYILPSLPALALLTASLEPVCSPRRLSASVGLTLLAAVVLFLCVLFAGALVHDPRRLEIFRAARPAIVFACAVMLAGALASWYAARTERPLPAVLSLATGWFLGIAILIAALGNSDSLRSGKSLALKIPADLAARAPVFSVETYDQTLPFYLKRTVTLVNYRGELDYGLQRVPERGIADTQAFVERWIGLAEGVAVMSHTTYDRLAAEGVPMRVLGEDLRRIAVSRR